MDSFILCQIKLKYFIFICSLIVGLFALFAMKLSARLDPYHLPVLVWWTPFMAADEKVIECYNEFRCLLTQDRTRTTDNKSKMGAYLFYGSQLQHHDMPLPRNEETLWAIFHEESPKNLASFLHPSTQNLFNVTATFSRYSTLPLTFQYLQSLHNLTDRTYFISLEEKNSFLSILAPVLYLQSDCDTPIERDKYVSELMNYIDVDSYGMCLNNKKLPDGIAELDPLDFYNEKIMHFTAKYKFTLAIENAVCHDYVTEKLWRPLIAGSVPIYLGSPTVSDWLPNKNSAILLKNYQNMQQLGADIKKLNEDDKLYEIFLEHKLAQKVDNNQLKVKLSQGFYGMQPNNEDDTPIPVFECFVCKLVYENGNTLVDDTRSVYDCPRPQESKNSWQTHWDIGKCQSKVFSKLIEKGDNITQEEFEYAWWKFYENGDC